MTPLPISKWSYVDHPRFGDKPRYTGLDVSNLRNDVFIRCMSDADLESWIKEHNFYWIDPDRFGCLIPGTAIVADPSLQRESTIPVTHYYDIRRKCRDCGGMFIFFAEEQKYWYEVLQFTLDADCVRCYPCRQRQQHIRSTHRSYDDILEVASPTTDQLAELAIARLDLVASGIFHSRQLDHVRGFLNRHSDHPRSQDIRRRLSEVLRRKPGEQVSGGNGG